MDGRCLACGWKITYPLYNPRPQPLAALALPRSAQAARSAERLPMDFHICARCGHVFNVAFEYSRVPYEQDSNLMYNRGARWQDHLRHVARLLGRRHALAGKTLVDIGCGDGLFFRLLGEEFPGTRLIGFEPGNEAEHARRNGLEVYRDYFEPERDLKRLRPDGLVCRHVLEHLENPRDFVASIAYWCNRYELSVLFLAEVPRIDRALAERRVTDFLYEHVSNFSELSLRMMFEAAGYEVVELESCYGDEVAVAAARPLRTASIEAIRRRAESFRLGVAQQQAVVRSQLERLLASGRRVAFWGATGKGAAFLNALELSAERFPLVVDSDANKLGRFVAGTGQAIRAPEFLKAHPVEVIVITTRWRAADIVDQMQREGIRCEEVLVLEQGKLTPYAGAESWEDETSLRIEGAHPAALPLHAAAARRRARSAP